MRRMLACWVAVGCLAQAQAVEARTKLTRSRALYLAKEQNPQVAASRAERTEAEARRGQADAALWPHVELEVGTGPAIKAELVPGTAVGSTRSAWDFEWDDLTVFVGGQARLVQPLYTFGKIARRRAAAAHGIEAATAQTRMTQAEVALAVARLYEGYLFAKDAELLAEEAKRIADNSLDQARALQEQGSTKFSESDILRLRVARSAAELALTQSRTGSDQARAGLEAYLGLAREGVTVSETALEPIGRVSPKPDDLIDLGLQHRPEVRALTEGAAAYGELARAERAGYFPDFFALGQITAAYTPGRDLLDTRYYQDPLHTFIPTVLVGFRWVLQANMPGQRAKEVQAKATRLEALLTWARQGIAAEVQVAHLDALRAQKDLGETEQALPPAKQWMVRASADYAAGLGSARELTDAVTAYLGMRTARMNAVMRLNVALARLSKATGTLVDGSGLYPGQKKGSD